MFLERLSPLHGILYKIIWQLPWLDSLEAVLSQIMKDIWLTVIGLKMMYKMFVFTFSKNNYKYINLTYLLKIVKDKR